MIENLAGREVLAHRCTTFHPRTYSLHRGTTAVVVTLINYDDERLLLGRTQGGRGNRDRLLHIYRRATTLDDCSNFSIALRV
jgi:hypothetical protein